MQKIGIVRFYSQLNRQILTPGNNRPLKLLLSC